MQNPLAPVGETPTRPRARALPPDQRRTAIVESTLPLILEHGHNVTTRQIADAAGIAEGTIFRVFADKDELVLAVIDAALDTAPLDRELRSIDEDLDLNKALTRAVDIMQQRIVSIWRLLSAAPRPREDGPAPRPVSESEALVDLLRRYKDCLALPPRTAARLLRSFTLAATHPMMVSEPLSPREVVTFFLNGAARRPC
ncbi:MAG TPA: helix-turn-helix domain-containing protein [Acidimicrobiales bacterium]|nr:helix-turn-helix domain-containing protein [Acidimicrobiales bacterium]